MCCRGFFTFHLLVVLFYIFILSKTQCLTLSHDDKPAPQRASLKVINLTCIRCITYLMLMIPYEINQFLYAKYTHKLAQTTNGAHSKVKFGMTSFRRFMVDEFHCEIVSWFKVVLNYLFHTNDSLSQQEHNRKLYYTLSLHILNDMRKTYNLISEMNLCVCVYAFCILLVAID